MNKYEREGGKTVEKKGKPPSSKESEKAKEKWALRKGVLQYGSSEKKRKEYPGKLKKEKSQGQNLFPSFLVFSFFQCDERNWFMELDSSFLPPFLR